MKDQFRKFVENFLSISDADFALFEERAFVKHCHKNEIITKEGEVEKFLYFVAKGVIQHYFKKGKETITTELVGEGGVVGSASSLFTKKPSLNFIQVLQPSILVGISNENLEYLYAHSRAWQKAGRLLMSHFLIKQEQQYIDVLKYPIRERLVRFANSNPDIIHQIPQARIASYLKIKPETYTRIKHVLTEVTIINSQKKVTSDKA